MVKVELVIVWKYSRGSYVGEKIYLKANLDIYRPGQSKEKVYNIGDSIGLRGTVRFIISQNKARRKLAKWNKVTV